MVSLAIQQDIVAEFCAETEVEKALFSATILPIYLQHCISYDQRYKFHSFQV